jgi:hypothetical protein
MRALLSATLLVAIAGCHKAETSIGDRVSPHLECLYLLQNLAPSAERDEGYACLAEDACGEGLPDLAHVALNQIESDALRDTIAIECALLLGRAGPKDHAPRIAQLIRNGDQRHNVMRQVRLARRK